MATIATPHPPGLGDDQIDPSTGRETGKYVPMSLEPPAMVAPGGSSQPTDSGNTPQHEQVHQHQQGSVFYPDTSNAYAQVPLAFQEVWGVGWARLGQKLSAVSANVAFQK